MIQLGRLQPMESQRCRHTFRAIVVKHTSHTTGQWWWKRNHPSVTVRFIDEDFAKFPEILRRETSDADGHFMSPPLQQEVDVGFPSEDKRDAFKIGEEVEVMFSTASALPQFFTGAQPFRWDGLKKKTQAVEMVG